LSLTRLAQPKAKARPFLASPKRFTSLPENLMGHLRPGQTATGVSWSAPKLELEREVDGHGVAAELTELPALDLRGHALGHGRALELVGAALHAGDRAALL